MESKKPRFLEDKLTFVNFESTAKDFLKSIFGTNNQTLEERTRTMENEAIKNLQEEKHSAYEIKDSLAKIYMGKPGFFENLSPGDVHILKFNKKDNSIVYKIGTYMQSGYLDLIIGFR